MKTSGFLKKSFLLSVIFFIPLFLLAQSPKLVSYQAVVRDGSNQPIINTDVTLTMSLNQGSAAGIQVYSETHSASTNAFGLVSVFLGNGLTTDNFSTIDWSNSPYYLTINVDGKAMAPVQIVSVPYAIYADEAGNVFSGNYNDLINLPTLNTGNWNTAYGWGDHATQGYLDSKWRLNGSTIYNPQLTNVSIGSDQATTGMLTVTSDPMAVSTDPAFQVINQNGFVVFEVLNNGSVAINIDESPAKGPKGGFAIGGFDATKGLKQPYLSIDPDSTRLYFNETTTKGPKGGFAIGGFNAAKGSIDKYVEVRGDRAGAGKNVFLGQYAGGKEGYTSTSNIAIGNNAGLNLGLNSANNVFIGEEAGMLASIYQNVFIGTGAGKNCSSGYNNIYIGYLSGSEGHGQYNVFIGDEAGRYNNGGYGNVFMGDKTGQNVVDGDRNTLLGAAAGKNLNNGMDNAILGFGAGGGLANSNENTIIGSYAGSNITTTGSNNLFVGYRSGSYISSGSNNIFLGSIIGPTSGSENILIGNRPTSTLGTSADGILAIDNSIPYPLSSSFIYGDMPASQLTLNAYTGIRTAPDILYGLTVLGNIHATGTVTSSDARMKHNIKPIANPLSTVLALRGVTFNWNSDIDPDENKSLGFIAQETKEIIPEMVSEGSDGMMAINYAPITALLVEAIKELKKENDELREGLSKVEELERQVQELRALISK